MSVTPEQLAYATHIRDGQRWSRVIGRPSPTRLRVERPSGTEGTVHVRDVIAVRTSRLPLPPRR